MKFTHACIAAVIVVMVSCNTSDQKTAAPAATDTAAISKPKNDTVMYGEYHVDTIYTAKEKKIMNMISKLPEFIKSNAYIDSISGHTHGLALMIFKPAPEKNENNYYVKAGFNRPDRFETYYNFYVDSATFKIKIDDVTEGDIVSLDEWRKRELRRK